MQPQIYEDGTALILFLKKASVPIHVRMNTCTSDFHCPPEMDHSSLICCQSHEI